MTTMLQAENVSKSFGGIQALLGVSFSVQSASITSIIGPNGAGKSTLLSLITCVEHANSGRIVFAGRDITSAKPHELAALGMARTFQLVRTFKGLSALENVMIGGHSRASVGMGDLVFRPGVVRSENHDVRSRARECLALVGFDAQKMDINTELLPFADQRSVELARALMAEPRLLLMDEPASGLDAGQVAEWLGQIKAVRQRTGLTIVLVEHRMPIVMNISDNVVVLNFGEKIAEGPPAVVQRDPLVRKAYLGDTYAGS